MAWPHKPGPDMSFEEYLSGKTPEADFEEKLSRRQSPPRANFRAVASVGLPDGRYVPLQPHPFYDRKHFWRTFWLCRVFGEHKPGVESDGWFCERCLKQLR